MTQYQVITRRETITYKTREYAEAAAAKLAIPFKIVARTNEYFLAQERERG